MVRCTVVGKNNHTRAHIKTPVKTQESPQITIITTTTTTIVTTTTTITTTTTTGRYETTNQIYYDGNETVNA
jgi:hypothetical protein